MKQSIVWETDKIHFYLMSTYILCLSSMIMEKSVVFIICFAQGAMSFFTKRMGDYSVSEKVEFEDSDGVLHPHDCTWIGGEKLKKFLQDMYGPNGRNYQSPGVNICLDSGAGKFLVGVSGYDRAKMGDPTGTDNT